VTTLLVGAGTFLGVPGAIDEEAAMTHGGNGIVIRRRTLVAAMAACCAVGTGIGELAASPGLSQARARTAAVPAACSTFANDAGKGFQILGGILIEAGKYPPLIPLAYKAGTAHSTTKLNNVANKLSAINAAIGTKSKKFAALKAPLISTEKTCLSG
jgi:hypothetical protein